MRNRWLTAVSIALVAVALVPMVAVAQSANTSEPLRTAWGAPDLEGMWDFRTLTPLQRPDDLADKAFLFTEMIHEARVVPLDGRPLLPEDMHQWLGDSRGHWEGDTLVVDTRNFTDKSSFSGGLIGRGASGETYHLVERFTRVDAETLLYEFTVEDPTWWTRPWTAAIPMKTTEGPIFEYACNEGNYGMTNLLTGARAQER